MEHALPDALDELQAAGYRPATLDQAIAAAAAYMGLDELAAVFFVTGQSDLVQVA